MAAKKKTSAHAPLNIQMVPTPLWGKNLRAVMDKHSNWRRIRSALLAKGGLTCATCGKSAEHPSDLKGHEEWIYFERAEPAVAWLWRVSLVCFHCHAAEHPGSLNAMIAEGKLSEQARIATIAHFCKVNGVKKRQWTAQLNAAYRDHNRRSGRQWYIDYGPFAEWMVTRYETDPLNGGAWPEHMETKWGGDHPTPSIEAIIDSFAASPAELRPESSHGFLAYIVEEVALKKAAGRQSKALKRQRVKKKALLQTGSLFISGASH